LKINFDATINDFDGKPVKVSETEALSLKTVALNSLMAQFPDEQHLGGEEKARRFALAMRLHGGGEIDIQPEEAAQIKVLIGKAYGALTVGRAYELLNG
jgi:hypothetical protein